MSQLNEKQAIFFQIPKFLFFNYRYRKLSLGAKLMYMLLKDRQQLSIKRQWRDQAGEVYFIFSNQELGDMLGLSEHTIIKHKRELERCRLLRQVRQGLNKPNRLYLLSPELTAADVYAQTQQKQQKPKTAVKPKRNLRRLNFSRKNYSDQTIAEQNRLLLKQKAKFVQDHDLLNEEGTRLLSQWCQTPAQHHQLVGVILGAKKQAQADLQQIGRADLLEFDSPYAEKGSDQQLKFAMTKALHKFFNAVRQAEDNPHQPPICNQEKYLYTVMINAFHRFAHQQLELELAPAE